MKTQQGKSFKCRQLDWEVRTTETLQMSLCQFSDSQEK